jgi:hypothetical protein
VFVTSGAAAEPWGTGSRDADDYDVQMTEQGAPSGHYTCRFDASNNIPAGVYRVCIYLQAGANPVDADIAIAQGEIYWDGSAEINEYTLDSDIGSVSTVTDNLKKRIGAWR